MFPRPILITIARSHDDDEPICGRKLLSKASLAGFGIGRFYSLFTIRELRANTPGTRIPYILFISLDDGSEERLFDRDGKRCLRERAVV